MMSASAPSAATESMPFVLAGQTLYLRGDHSLYWPATRTLFVADTHFGKAGVFRQHGMGLPAGTTDTDLERLAAALADTGARRLVVLGDLVHAPPAADAPWLTRFAAWRRHHDGVEILVTRGNHDRGDALPIACDVIWHDGGLFEAPFMLRHEPGRDDRGPVLAGHIHPVVRLGAGTERLRAPVFWQHAGGLVLPAFSSFAGGGRISPRPGDRIFAVGEGAVVEIPTG